MKRRRPYLYLLLAALGLTVIIPVAIAQTRRATQAAGTPLQEAVKALNEGRYDEVAALVASQNQQDPRLSRSRRGRSWRAANTRTPKRCFVRSRSARRRARPRSNSAAARRCSDVRKDRRLQRIADIASRATQPAELRPVARALDALGHNQDANDLFREATNLAPKDIAIQTAWGEFFIDHNCRDCKPNALKSFDLVLAEDSRWSAALLGTARALVDEDPPKAGEFAKRRSRSIPSYVDAYVFVAGESVDAGRRDEARKALQKALDVNPNSLDAHMRSSRRSRTSRTRRLNSTPKSRRSWRSRRTTARSTASRASSAAHNYRFEEAVALTRRALALSPDDATAHRRRSGALAAHRRRTGRACRARGLLGKRLDRRGHVQPAEHDGHVGQVRDGHRG
jgi:tetratricopeptide (TPR) repeat protein